MPDRNGGSGWVDPPDLPDPRQWSGPAAQAPGWRDHAAAPPPAPTRRRASRATAGWAGLVLVGVLALVRAVVVGGAAPQPQFERVVDDTVLVTYDAADGVLGAATNLRDEPGAADRGTHEQLWAEWTALVPSYWARRVTMFEIATDGTGSGGFAAYVQPLDDAGERWLLSVDPADAAEHPDYYHQTLVHELAHVFTLGAGRVDIGVRPFTGLADRAEECGRPAVPLGCPTEGSLVARYVERFWSPQDMTAADAAHASGDLERAVLALYAEQRTRFVTPYAASGPGEDLAETFVALALDQSLPAGSVAADKVAFLRADAELFSLADRLRVALRAG